jgi:energy-coupling factor transporter ATP-binding protein EcfA2
LLTTSGPASSERLLRRIELQPNAIRVLTGPIGSGKSTELLVLARVLNGLPDVWATVIDLSLMHDLTDLREGTLIAAALIGAPDELRFNPNRDQRLRLFAYGGTSDASSIFVPGALSPSKLTTLPAVDELLRALRSKSEARKRTGVFLFDSLDRVRDPDGFRTVLEGDARLLVNHGFGVIMTAPLSTLWSDAGELRAMTDTWEILSYEDPAKRSDARSFLLEILRRRADDDLLPESTWPPLVDASGGVLRDLIELARRAVEEAYLEGHDAVGQREIDLAMAGLAHALTLGLDGTSISTLLSVQATHQVRTFDEPTLRLLKNRQILEHRDSTGSYFEPHPVLGSLLQRWAEAS